MSLAATLRAARLACELSASALAERSSVSRAMIGKIERGEVQPTAALLGRLSGALRMTLSELVARAEGDDKRLVRVADQPTWIDPASGYRRRAVSPVSGCTDGARRGRAARRRGGLLPADAYADIHQQIWVLHGRLRCREGD